MVATQPLGGFIWGAGGQMLTPQEAERQRRLAEALMAKGSDYSPVGSPMEGMARVANALVGGLKQYKANAAEKRGIESANTDTVNAFGGGFDSLGAGSAAPTSVPATYTSGTATKPPESAQEFISMMTPAALEVSKQTGLDPRLVIAQSALETGWGKSAPGNNFFGIKSHGKSGGNTLATTEVVNGQPVKVNDSFRAYGDPTESAMDYAAFLKSNPRYRDMLGAKGLDAQIAALGASGYATDPNYADKVRSIATGLPPLDGIVDHGEAAGADPSALAFAPVQTTPPAALQAIQDNAARPMVQQPVPGDAEALAQAEPAADVSVVPLPQARPAAPVAPQNRMARVAQLMGGPVAVPDADPMHSNLQQSAGDFARASAAQRAGIPQNIPQSAAQATPQAQQPTGGILTGRSAVPGIMPQRQPGIIPQPAQANPQQSRLAALAAVANNQFATPQVRALAVQQIQALTKPQEPKIVTAPDGTILAINPRDTAHPQTVYRSGGYRPMTAEEKQAFGVPADQAAYMGPDGKPQTLGKGGITINNSPDGALFAGLPKDVRAEMFKRQGEAQDAANLIGVTNQGLQLLDEGTITGAGSTGRVAAIKWAQALGVDVPKNLADAVNNTEAYRSIMAKAVATVIKNFGSGTGLSDQDRAYAERLAGGDTTLNEPAIRRILTAGMEQSKRRIAQYETMRDKVLSGDMSALLGVDEPPAYTPQTSGGTTSGGVKWSIEP